MNQLSSTTKNELLNRAKPFFAVIFLQFGFAGMDVLSKVALNEGMSNYVFVVYRHVIAFVVMTPFAVFLDKKTRPRMTLPIFIKIVILGLLEPVIDQNLYFLGMKHTTATFAAAMVNILPAITLIMAYICRLEKVKLKSIYSHAKIAGTVATVAGAMVMTLLRGPSLHLPWTKATSAHEHQGGVLDLPHLIKGALMITVGCFSWAAFMILQAITLKTYPVELSLTSWICLLGAAEGAIVALIMERGKAAVWAINWDTKLLAALYTGIVCSGIAYYVQGVIMKDRGPVFVTAFSPLSMVIVAVMSSFILGEQMFLGRILGAIIIVAGLYVVVWGKSKDYKSPSTDEEATSDTEKVNADNSMNDKYYQEPIKINVSTDAIATKDEGVLDEN